MQVLATRHGYTLSYDGAFYYVTVTGTSAYVFVSRSATQAAQYLASC